MSELFDFYRSRLESMLSQGTSVGDATLQAQIDTELQFRGERVYIAGPSRQVRARQVAKLGQMKIRDMAVATGLSVRTIKVIRNGR